MELVNEKNKLEEENKLDETSTKIVVESKVETKKPQHKKINPFFRRFF